MATFWPLHHYNQCMGENGRKTLSTALPYIDCSGLLVYLMAEGACVADTYTRPSLGQELYSETLLIDLSAWFITLPTYVQLKVLMVLCIYVYIWERICRKC